MPNFEVYDLPLKIHTTESKAAALELLRSRPDIQYGRCLAERQVTRGLVG